jgi:hypothetical protein
MKINKNETHDRLLLFKQQSDFISQGCQECINNRPQEFGNFPFYIFAHSRTIEIDERIAIFNDSMIKEKLGLMQGKCYNSFEEVPTARLIWTPRLTKPTPQSNSMLFKAYPPGDNIKIIWMLPAMELWGQYEKGNLTEHKTVKESINDYKTNFERLSAREDDDLPDEVVQAIYSEIAKNKTNKFEMV